MPRNQTINCYLLLRRPNELEVELIPWWYGRPKKDQVLFVEGGTTHSALSVRKLGFTIEKKPCYGVRVEMHTKTGANGGIR